MGQTKIVGQRFERLEIVETLERNASGHLVVLCQCDCGSIKKLPLGRLRSGGVKSCGCLRREIAHRTGANHHGYQHGHATQGETPTYCSWRAMINRCQNPKDSRYQDYGGRGITVCERWKSFLNFLADMGERPEGQTLDRIDNDKGYYLENCKWSTAREQQLNRRSWKWRNG